MNELMPVAENSEKAEGCYYMMSRNRKMESLEGGLMRRLS